VKLTEIWASWGNTAPLGEITENKKLATTYINKQTTSMESPDFSRVYSCEIDRDMSILGKYHPAWGNNY
jgi:hypothetical protein